MKSLLDKAKIKLLPHFSRLSREFLLILAGQIATITGLIAGIKVLTKSLSPEAYGMFALGLSIAAIANSFLLTPISSSATRFFATASERNELNPFFKAIIRLSNKAAVITAICGILFLMAIFYYNYSNWAALIIAAIFYSFVVGISSILAGLQNAARQRALVAIHSGIDAWGKFCLAKCLTVYFGPTGTVALWGYGLFGLITICSQCIFFKRTLSPDMFANTGTGDTKTWEHRLYSYSWPFATWGLLETANLNSGRWALQFFSSTEHVGYFAVLYQLGFYPLNVLSGLIAQLIAPILFKIAGIGNNQQQKYKTNTLVKYFSIGGVIITIIVAFTIKLLAQHIFAIFVDPAYIKVAYLLPWITIAGGFFATAQITTLGPLCGSESKSLIKPKIASAACGIIINMICGCFYGIEGVVGASVISSTLYLLWMLIIIVRQPE